MRGYHGNTCNRPVPSISSFVLSPHKPLLTLPDRLAKVLLSLPRPITNRSDNHPANALLQSLNRALKALRDLHTALDRLVLPARLVAQESLESASNALLVLRKVVDHSVGTGVESVAADNFTSDVVDGVAQPHRRTGSVVHVENWRRGVEASGVEVVRVFHGQRGEGFEVTVMNRLFHGDHALGHDVVGALLEERRGRNGGLHAAGGGHVFLLGAGDEDAGAHVGPVAGGSDFVGQAVAAILLLALLPAGVAAEQAPASGAGALTSNLAEVGGSRGELVEVGDGADESGKACCAGGQAGGCGEVVLGDHLELQVGELGLVVVFGLDILS